MIYKKIHMRVTV